MKLLGFLVGLLVAVTMFLGMMFAAVHLPKPFSESLIGALLVVALIVGGFYVPFKVGVAVARSFGKMRTPAMRAEQARATTRLLAEHESSLQSTLQSSLAKNIVDAANLADLLKAIARNIEIQVNLAEGAFREGAFAPFWDAIEGSVNALARFTSKTEAILDLARKHREAAKQLKGSKPQFRIGIETLPDASSLEKRMQSLVRQAQTNFQFAMIFEQRKTNQLLEAGFENLYQAINEVGRRLDSSLAKLRYEISEGLSEIASENRSIGEALTRELRDSRDQAEQDAAEIS